MKKHILTLIACGICISVHTKVVLPAYFTDNMVIQQKTNLTILGKSDRKQTVRIKTNWSSKSYQATPDTNGNFKIQLSTPKAGGPYTLTIDDGDVRTLQNVLVGEVWFCSGQSNMEMPISGWGKVLEYEKEIAAANYPSIRLLQVTKKTAHTPSDDVEINGGSWSECNSTTVPNFSSIAYFYARTLWNELKTPIGVIDCTWGGTPAEAWTSLSTLKQVWGIQDRANRIEQCNADKELLKKEYHLEIAEWEKQFYASDAGMENGRPRWIDSEQKGNEWKQMDLPGSWEYKGLPEFDGVVWFQKVIDIPMQWIGKEVKLNLGMIDDEDITYFNGKEIAKGNGYYVKRHYTIPAEMVKSGKGIITVKVQDRSGSGGICGDSKDLSLEANGEHISLAGKWNYRIGVSLDRQPSVPEAPESQNYPSTLYNAMVYPFRQFPIKGVIWYQGESNVNRATQYTPLFQAMITDWRNTWQNKFPFYFVQLANFLNRQEVQPNSKWAYLREAQDNALHLEKTGMAVTIDIGEAYDIHPKNKQEVGKRLARLALADTYNKGEYQIPTYQEYRIEGASIVLLFNQKINTKDSQSGGFVIAGADMKFYPARAVIDSNKITISSPDVPMPIAVRYGWADNPPCYLYGDNGLPIAPFRTDKFNSEKENY